MKKISECEHFFSQNPPVQTLERVPELHTQIISHSSPIYACLTLFNLQPRVWFWNRSVHYVAAKLFCSNKIPIGVRFGVCRRWWWFWWFGMKRFFMDIGVVNNARRKKMLRGGSITHSLRMRRRVGLRTEKKMKTRSFSSLCGNEISPWHYTKILQQFSDEKSGKEEESM